VSQEQVDYQKVQDDYYNEMEQYFQKLADELDCSVACATDIWYLRQRSRWTQELENELLRLYDIGQPPNICEFGN
jgi:hypothetical protein